MTARECILLIDDDPAINDALSVLLDRDGRTTIVCADLESAEIALTRYPVTHVVTDVQFSGSFGFEGLHSLSRLRELRPGCRLILMTGFASDELRSAAFAHGASAVLAKPFQIEQLEAVLVSSGDLPAESYEVIRIPPLDEILAGGILDCAFQPIVRLHDGKVSSFGFEALTRMRDAWPLGGPAELFEYAARRSRLTELNLAAMQCAVGESAHLPHDATIFINVDPNAFAADIVSTLRHAASRGGLDLSRVVLEVTERSAFHDEQEAGRTFDALRDLGVRFALDDHGSAYSHLSVISRIRPSFVKISQSFGTAFEEDDTKGRIIRHIIALARDFGAQTVLEGIEEAATASAAAAIGIDYAQGYHFGRPSAASHWAARRAA